MTLRRMLLLRGAVAACALAGAAPVTGRAAADATPAHDVDVTPHVAQASLRFGIPEAWIYAVIRVESAGRVRAVSSAGAIGLMQLMPGTWARQRTRFALGPDPFDPRDNIIAGTSYLREMHDRYGAVGFLAAYNAGPRRYEDWRDRGRALPAETRAYVAKLALLLQPGSASAVMPEAARPRPVRVSWTEAALFPGRKPAASEASDHMAAAAALPRSSSPSVPVAGVFAPVSGGRRE